MVSDESILNLIDSNPYKADSQFSIPKSLWQIAKLKMCTMKEPIEYFKTILYLFLKPFVEIKFVL